MKRNERHKPPVAGVLKKNRLRACIILTVLPMLLLASCGTAPAAAGESTQSQSPHTSPAVTSPLPAASDTASAAPSPSPTEWHSGVKTNYSGLTSYKALQEKYTRLSDGALPVLSPSGNYGKLLPYIGQSLYGDGGYNAFNLYGLVTADARIVTDPVYSGVDQGSYYDYGTNTSISVPVYDLEKLAKKINKNNPWESMRHAVCALDGSWVTDFDYMGVYFTDTVIMCIRDNEKNDVDMLDYNGKLLYNTTSLSCYKDIPPQSGYAFQNGYGEGQIAVQLSTGKTVYIDAKTGAETMTDYMLGEAFYSGYARVRDTAKGPFGYINRNYELVIKPQFMYADIFSGGRTVVQQKDGSYAVIDGAGTVLFKNQFMINRWDKNTYGVFDANNNVTYYDGDFKQIAAGKGQLSPLYGGWFYYPTESGSVLMKGSEKYMLDGISQINSVTGGLVSYLVNKKDTWEGGIVALDGKTIVPPEQEVESDIVVSPATGNVYIILNRWQSDGSFKSYTILTKDGKEIMSGKGFARFNETNDLFEINDMQSFGFADAAGKYVFRISLLQYVPD